MTLTIRATGGLTKKIMQKPQKEGTMSDRSPRRSVQPAILAYLQQHPGEEITLDRLSRAVREMIKAEPVKGTLQTTMARLANNTSLYKLTVLSRGQVWRFEGFADGHQGDALDTVKAETHTPRAGDLLEVVGTTKNGSLMVRDNKDRLYTAEEM